MAQTLDQMLADTATPIAEIATWLDGLDWQAARDVVFSLDRAGQRALYQRAEGGIDADHFVPEPLGACVEVIHHGRNSLPLPSSQRLFQKRFCRNEAGDRLFGYNEAPTRGLIGPGYFVAYPTADSSSDWQGRGGVVVDYFQVPDGPVVDGWPRVVPNTRGIQFFVYNKTRDFMRRVSARVSIGAAYKKEKSLDHYFVLVRDRSAS